MILVELSKADFTEHGRFLGEHKWKDFLRRPDAEHKKRSTQVFHSFYSTPRDAEKDGMFDPSTGLSAEPSGRLETISPGYATMLQGLDTR